MLYRLNITLSDDDYFKECGWISCRLTSAPADFSIVDPDKVLRSYAARIPPIEQPRQLFAPILFPVVKAAQPNGDFDTLKIEASDYDDGFAKVVHAVQPVSANILAEEADGIHVQKDIGVRLGWDDEQILIWQNRQMLSDPATGQRIEAPLGVFSYRVDVREKNVRGTRSCAPLRALSRGNAGRAPHGSQDRRQVFPSRQQRRPARSAASHFTQWYGPSLVLPDGKAAQLDASPRQPGTYGGIIKRTPDRPGNLCGRGSPQRGSNTARLQFRVRLAVSPAGPVERQRVE